MASISFGEREGQVVDIDISFAQPVEPKPRVPNLVTRPNVVDALDPNQQLKYCPDILQTDASDRGLGAVLLQGPPEGRHPVAFISRKLFPRETRYSTIEKECLAVKWAITSLKYYLLGREFLL